MQSGTSQQVRLTVFASGGGCATKIGQADLLRLLGGWPQADDPRVLIGSKTGDDAAVVRLVNGEHLVFTTDFFAPIVDDPYDYGAISATNALSDVYAMGGTPLVALNLVAWPPEDVLPHAILRKVLDAARDVVTSAGASVAGGHSITDAEPKFGLAVVGTVVPSELMTNSAGRPGDVLLLSKALGTGIIANALKRGEADPEVLRSAIASMRLLNAGAARVARNAGVRCATDITGFGLLGHLHSMSLASGCAAEIDASALPVLPGVRELIDRGMVPGGTMRNLRFASEWAEWKEDVPEWSRVIATDAQTSGGLLLAGTPEVAANIRRSEALDPAITTVGSLIDGAPGSIHVV